MNRTSVLMAALACVACSAQPPGSDRQSPVSQQAAAPVAVSVPAPRGGRLGEGVLAPSLPAAVADSPSTSLPPNELGRVLILEYHLIGAENTRWTVTPAKLRGDLELLWQRGYRPVSLQELVDRSFQLPAGTSPVVITFDDASPGQFRYLEQDGSLSIDPESAVGVWLEFARQHPRWGNKAVFCLLSGAEAGRAFFGDKGIEGQETAWRLRKVAFLVEQGFELCNHTLWHASLASYGDDQVQEQIARLQLAVDSAAPGYRIRSLALPLGLWPKNRALAERGGWTDPKTGKRTEYRHDVVLRVAGGPARSPHDSAFNALSLPRVQVFADALERILEQLDASGTRYVSDGDPARVAIPTARP